jgi:hypothetical protein
MCRQFEIGDAFVGYHSDTIPSMVLQVCIDFGYDGDMDEASTNKVDKQGNPYIVKLFI